MSISIFNLDSRDTKSKRVDRRQWQDEGTQLANLVQQLIENPHSFAFHEISSHTSSHSTLLLLPSQPSRISTAQRSEFLGRLEFSTE